MIINSCVKKLPKYLFYTHTLDKDICIESHRMISTKTGEYLGEMITYPQDFYYFNLETPGVQSLYISYLEVYRHNEGLGTKFLNFAKVLSKQKGCSGRLHLISSDCYDKDNPPHIFYRKYGFDSLEANKLNEIDTAILHSNNKFNFYDIGMFYPPKAQTIENSSKTKSLLEKLKQKLKITH